MNVENAVVFREPLVDEGVVRRHQIEHWTVAAHDAFEEQFGLALERLPQVVVEIREQPVIRVRGSQIAQVQPLIGKALHQRVRPRVDEHSTHLLLQDRRIFQLAASRRIEQRIVGNAAPEEK